MLLIHLPAISSPSYQILALFLLSVTSAQAYAFPLFSIALLPLSIHPYPSSPSPLPFNPYPTPTSLCPSLPLPIPTNTTQGLTYLRTPDYTVSTLHTIHPTRPMTLYKGPHSLFRALAPKYRLNKAEYLQLYNLRPSTQVMLELVIEEVRPLPASPPTPAAHAEIHVPPTLRTLRWRTG
jgi:hypothetical protein